MPRRMGRGIPVNASRKQSVGVRVLCVGQCSKRVPRAITCGMLWLLPYGLPNMTDAHHNVMVMAPSIVVATTGVVAALCWSPTGGACVGSGRV